LREAWCPWGLLAGWRLRPCGLAAVSVETFRPAETKHAPRVFSFRGMRSFHVLAACGAVMPRKPGIRAGRHRAAGAQLTALPLGAQSIPRNHGTRASCCYQPRARRGTLDGRPLPIEGRLSGVCPGSSPRGGAAGRLLLLSTCPAGRPFHRLTSRRLVPGTGRAVRPPRPDGPSPSVRWLEARRASASQSAPVRRGQPRG
jgi:hypothetical protein